MNKGPMDGARDGSASNRRSHVSWGNRLIREKSKEQWISEQLQQSKERWIRQQ